MARPDLKKVPEFYHNYINLVQQEDIIEAIQKHTTQAITFLKKIPEERWSYRYAESKWSIKELVQHIIDAERIFSYRALRFARKDETPLPGFEEKTYAAASKADMRSKDDLLEELELVQKASAKLFLSFNKDQFESSGIANEKYINVLAIAFITVGHSLHHLNIIQQRYL